jgi:hypothetical protein
VAWQWLSSMSFHDSLRLPKKKERSWQHNTTWSFLRHMCGKSGVK